MQAVYELDFLTENRGLLNINPPPQWSSLELGELLESAQAQIESQWIPLKLGRMAKRKPLKDFILNTSSYAIISERAMNILKKVIPDAEYLPSTCEKETVYFFRPPILHFSQVLDLEHTILGAHDANEFKHVSKFKHVSAREVLNYKKENPEEFENYYFSIWKYHFLEEVSENLYAFRIDTSELNRSSRSRVIYVTELFQNLITENALDGFEYDDCNRFYESYLEEHAIS